MPNKKSAVDRCCQFLAFSPAAPTSSDADKVLPYANVEGDSDIDKAFSTLVHDAVAFIEEAAEVSGLCITYPVSKLQARFKLGYAKGCDLAEYLEQIGFWAIVFNEDKVRCANLQLGFVTRPTDNLTGTQ